MKNREGFVSNSSSSSFVVKKKDLTKEQIDKIINHVEFAKELLKSDEEFKNCHRYYIETDFDIESDKWNIEETEDEISGWTIMTNIDMGMIMKKIGVTSADFECDY